MKQGFYLQGTENKMDDTMYIKHSIVQINEPNDKGYCEEPLVRSVYLLEGVLPIMQAGTAITFELDSKMKWNEKKQTKTEVIIPVNIKVAKAKQQSV